MDNNNNAGGPWPWWRVLLAWAVVLPSSWVAAGFLARAAWRLLLVGWGLL